MLHRLIISQSVQHGHGIGVERNAMISFNELAELEHSFEHQPGARYRIFHFQLKEMHREIGLSATFLIILSTVQIILLAAILWRLW
jgi:hypothetical protein